MNKLPKNDNISPEHQVAKIFEWRRGFNITYLISLGIDLGLFKYLAQSPASTPQQIAESLSLHYPYIDTWCKTAFAVGILETENCTNYILADHFDKILANDTNPKYLGGYVKLGVDFVAKDFKFSVEAYKTGAKVPFQNRSESFAETVGIAISGLHALTANKLLPGLNGFKRKLETGCKILDVGCGTGKLVFQIAKNWRNVNVIGVDIDKTGLSIAKKQLAKSDLKINVEFVEGDIPAAGKPNSFDAITMIEVLHEISPKTRQKVLNNCYRLLKKEGWLLIVDETYPSKTEDFRKQEYQFPIQTAFEELTWGNILPTAEAQQKLIKSAGFNTNIDRKIIGEGFTILEVQK